MEEFFSNKNEVVQNNIFVTYLRTKVQIGDRNEEGKKELPINNQKKKKMWSKLHQKDQKALNKHLTRKLC